MALKDSIGFAGGDTNLYGYTLNDPINYIDANGEYSLESAIIVGVILGTVTYYGAKALWIYANKEIKPVGEQLDEAKLQL